MEFLFLKLRSPIFNAGRNQANLDIAEIRQQQSVVNYEQKIQNAFKEVADALALRQSLRTIKLGAQQRYLASLQITLQRARALYQHGAVKLSGSAGCRTFVICNPTNFT
ncbi:copper/silver efflux system outer membrane protein CusC [Escherichia coli]|uniref:Copper/silver efflux system outer membrane protein CusC n=1 Tax=Escherichia coli TaxID=562 RepID=A0A376KYU2_ECOLX|nr:copper/silver efflux system outer membrane protein CusC [Escherichia coli]